MNLFLKKKFKKNGKRGEVSNKRITSSKRTFDSPYNSLLKNQMTLKTVYRRITATMCGNFGEKIVFNLNLPFLGDAGMMGK